MPLHCVDDLSSSIQDGWGKSSEWMKGHGWQYQDVQDPIYMPISTFWGWRWCRIMMWTCYTALTVSLYTYSVLIHCVNNLSTIQEGRGKSSEWVKWHGWQYRAVQDPNYMTNTTFWGWRWYRIMMWTCYTARTVSLHCVDDLSTIQDGWGKSFEWVKWHGWQYQDVQDPIYMPNCTFWGWRWCSIAMQTCYCALTVSLYTV